MSHLLSPRLVARRYAVLAPALIAAVLTLSTGAQAQTLQLQDALARAGANDPSRPAVEERIGAAEAVARQAAVRPNPSIGVDLENFAGTGPYSLLDRAEATVTYEQTIERGGKRDARVNRARAEIDVVRLRSQVTRLDFLREVQLAFAEAMAAEAELLIAEARFIAATQFQTDITRRVERARDPLFAGARAETLTAQAEIARDQARTAASNARAVLAAFWGGDGDFSLDLQTFFDSEVPGSPPPLHRDLPDLGLLTAERDVALATVRLEQSRQVADRTVRAGLRYLGEGSGVALVVGGSIPLQRYDRNQANVDRALAERNAAEADIVAARNTRQREVARLTGRVAASAVESERIRAEVIPAALETVDLVRDGFNRGGFNYNDVTDAERALADARARRVAVLRQHHLDRAVLDRLTGRHTSLATSTILAETR